MEIDDEFVGRLVRSGEIGAIFGVAQVTVNSWRNVALTPDDGLDPARWRRALPDPVVLPAPLARIAVSPLWDREVLIEWGRRTGRIDAAGRPLRRSGFRRRDSGHL